MRTERDAQFALDGEVLDAGAAPHIWKDKKPGYSYLVANGIPEDAWATPLRDYLCSVDYLKWVVLTFAEVRAEIDPVTAGAAARAVDRAFTARTRYPLPGTAELETYVDDTYDEDGYDGDQDDYDSLEGDVVDAEVDEEEFADPEAELPEVENVVDFAQPVEEAPRVKLTLAEARAAMEDLLDEFEEEGREMVRPADFMEHCDRHGRSRSWVSGQVSAFVMAGRLAETNEVGRYRIVPHRIAA